MGVSDYTRHCEGDAAYGIRDYSTSKKDVEEMVDYLSQSRFQ